MDKKIIGAIIIGAVVIIGFFVFSGSSTETTETAEFGSWGQQIIFEYRDGSTSADILSFLHNNEPVDKVHYILKASASATEGSDFTEVEFDPSGIELRVGVQNSVAGSIDVISYPLSSISNIPVNGDMVQLLSKDFDTGLIPSSVENDDYTFFMKLQGILKYRGVSNQGHGEWKHCTLPDPLTAQIGIGPAGDVSVDLSQDTDYTYGESTSDNWVWEMENYVDITFTQEQLDSAQDAYASFHESYLAEYHPEIIFHTCGSVNFAIQPPGCSSSSCATYDFQSVNVPFDQINIQIEPSVTYTVMKYPSCDNIPELIIPK